MMRRATIVMLVLGLPTTLGLSQLSYVRTLGLQSAGWSLGLTDGTATLARWELGRPPNVRAPGGTAVMVSIDPFSELARMLPGATRGTVVDATGNEVLDAPIVLARREAVVEESLARWQPRPLVPKARTAVWLSVDPAHHERLNAARSAGPLTLAVRSAGRMFSRGAVAADRLPLFKARCDYLAGWRPMHRALHKRVSMWWITAALVTLAAVLLAGRVKGILQMARRERHGLCVHCGYDLRSSPLRCPECNAPFPTGAALRRLRAVHRSIKIAVCVTLGLSLAALAASYFEVAVQQGQTRIMLSGASVQMQILRRPVPAPRVLHRRLMLPRTYHVSPKLRWKPMRLIVPMWIPVLGLVLALYWMDIRPRRRAIRAAPSTHTPHPMPRGGDERV